MNIKIKLKAHKSTQYPYVRVAVNDREYYNGLLDAEIVELDFYCIDLLDHNMLIIEHHSKTNRDTIVDQGKIIADRAVELLELTIADYVVPRNILYNKPFYPIWPQNIIDDANTQNHILPEYIDKNLFFGFNGQYRFNFPKDFKQEYYNYYWDMEKTANQELQTLDESNTPYFEAYGLRFAINQKFNYTISDLKFIIDNEQLPTNN
jgi:hypothetical protein